MTMFWHLIIKSKQWTSCMAHLAARYSDVSKSLHRYFRSFALTNLKFSALKALICLTVLHVAWLAPGFWCQYIGIRKIYDRLQHTAGGSCLNILSQTGDGRVSLHLPSLECSRDQAKTWWVPSPFPWLACIKIWWGAHQCKWSRFQSDCFTT